MSERLVVGGDNHEFSINGLGEPLLKEHIRLVLLSSWDTPKLLIKEKIKPLWFAIAGDVSPNDPKYDIIAQFPVKPNEYLLSNYVHNLVQNCHYPREPNHDGHNKKGWRLFKEHNMWTLRCVFAIEPLWIEFHK